MSLELKDMYGWPLDNGFYENESKTKFHYIRKDGVKYFISSEDEEEKLLQTTPGLSLPLIRACPHDYLERRIKEKEEVVREKEEEIKKLQEFIASKSGTRS